MVGMVKKIIPKSVFDFFQPVYHYLLALTGAIIYRFPSRKLLVIGVTGTKGKSTTAEIVNAIFEASEQKTALQNTLRFKVGDEEKRNLFKMSMPGRFFMQKFLRDAVNAGCSVAILELTSEGAKQYRHKFIDLDALIFTNLAPEHIESHGSYENYVKAKLSIARELEKNEKGIVVVNTDDKEAEKFLALNIKTKIPYSLKDAFNIESSDKGNSFQIEKTVIHMKLGGMFNISNALGAIACAKHFKIGDEVIKKGIESLDVVRGRMEKINAGQDFDVVIDYAHTPDSLKAIYEAYKNHKTICILGNTGGGRDTWKRPEMGKIADKYCDQIILTNEDPYDEDPMKILEEMRVGTKKKPVEIIMDRRKAIASAITKASHFASPDGRASRDDQDKVAVLITGKGTDPYIMGPNGSKQEWDDATVVREELRKILKQDAGAS